MNFSGWQRYLDWLFLVAMVSGLNGSRSRKFRNGKVGQARLIIARIMALSFSISAFFFCFFAFFAHELASGSASRLTPSSERRGTSNIFLVLETCMFVVN